MTNKLKLKNKVYLPPMAKEGSVDGKIDPSLIEYYEGMAKKGFGLIVLEHAYVDINGKASQKQMSIDEEYDRDSLIKIKDKIHEHSAKAIMQISHAGRYTKVSKRRFGPVNEDGVEKLTVFEIKKIQDKFLEAAKRVRDMGFDGVEVHSAHGYLLNQFYSPLSNKRDDLYGGSLENRLRFLVEILEKIRKAMPDFPLFVRLGARDYEDYGNTTEDAIKASQILEKYIDYIDISGGMNGFLTHGDTELGYFADEARAVKDNTNLTVMMAGGIENQNEVKKLIDQGICDLVGIGRKALDKNFKLT